MLLWSLVVLFAESGGDDIQELLPGLMNLSGEDRRTKLGSHTQSDDVGENLKEGGGVQ